MGNEGALCLNLMLRYSVQAPSIRGAPSRARFDLFCSCELPKADTTSSSLSNLTARNLDSKYSSILQSCQHSSFTTVGELTCYFRYMRGGEVHFHILADVDWLRSLIELSTMTMGAWKRRYGIPCVYIYTKGSLKTSLCSVKYKQPIWV